MSNYMSPADSVFRHGNCPPPMQLKLARTISGNCVLCYFSHYIHKYATRRLSRYVECIWGGGAYSDENEVRIYTEVMGTVLF